MNTDSSQFITGREVAVLDMLNARDRRHAIQQELIRTHNATVISFTLNIPGPIKVFPLGEMTFEEGIRLIDSQLHAWKIPVLEKRTIRDFTGNEQFWSVKGDTLFIKEILCLLEDSLSFGRLFDIDVIRTDETKVSRTELGFPGRKCLLCSNDAFVCSRSRTHTVKELLDKACELMKDYFEEKQAKKLSSLSMQALLDEGDEIAGVRMTFGDNEVIVATHNGYAIRIRETDIREMSRVAHGVKAIKLRGSDYVVSMARVREGASVLTVAENGLGRRVPLESYKVQNRGGYGLMNYKSGGVCGIKVVDDEDDIIMISTDGIVIRIRACDISMMSRYSRGVRLMRVGEDGRVVSFTRTEHDDDVETAEVEKATAEEIAEAQAEENAEVIEDNTESVENEDSENTEE